MSCTEWHDNLVGGPLITVFRSELVLIPQQILDLAQQWLNWHVFFFFFFGWGVNDGLILVCLNIFFGFPPGNCLEFVERFLVYLWLVHYLTDIFANCTKQTSVFICKMQ